MVLYGPSLTVADNTISGNDADEGGGLYLVYSSPMITNTIIS